MVLLMASTFGMRAAMFCGLTTRLDRSGSGAESPLSGFSGSLPLLSLSTSSMGSSFSSATRGRTGERSLRRPPPCPPPEGEGNRKPLAGLAFRKLVEQAMLRRPHGGLRPRAEIQLAEDVGDVVLDRLVRQKEVGGDLLVGLAVRGQP